MRFRTWPTFVVIVCDYSLLFVLTFYWAAIPWPILLILAGIAAAWYSSLEHEILHGHPTKCGWFNRLMVLPPILLWVPFEVYARTHRAHHRDALLTDPFDDPESYYLSQDHWERLPRWQQRGLTLTNTLLGRLTLGLLLTIVRFWALEAQQIWAGTGDRRRIWLQHLLLSAGLIAYLVLVCAMPMWIYLVCFCVPGTALIMLRSFLEHQYEEDPLHRSVIVEAGWFWRLLFLNNCYHFVHHQHPSMPWYALPAAYARDRAAYLAKNGAYLWPGYASIVRAYALRAKEPVRHPVCDANERP